MAKYSSSNKDSNSTLIGAYNANACQVLKKSTGEVTELRIRENPVAWLKAECEEHEALHKLMSSDDYEVTLIWSFNDLKDRETGKKLTDLI